ncbi:Autophagy-related protein 3 B (Atg3B) [Monocercomonoides exilis]|uniref:Autophagy-related protein 3 B (Atg3B) n=1 Tax=Monocercomonoides exilis TaxID=2049356 RepID=UPI003559375D|nr:Autophagy-related protein 3 B (Atg3B) [Monocercomonoides exilis]|eukprot:MONOS_3432.1-p1 / transcript=MONOS_3432.1 / gene=MONOS_3432 / organism=Monocercomonoides_exilis_PA203 / gene_product=Autophagy-related protein 3 B (Atg3B) / transcript_product=Autophagy-related protein 3 B (Atg3B) / location=Mono_scaffold00081:31739-32999(-) / protein_length=271 / sequence_SO=supercontig / SO=protein_coding / is_pseudo=false
MSFIDKIDRAIREKGKKEARKTATVPTKSTFLQDGKVTPAEFVQAGDLLRSKCPQWHWCTGKEENILPYLPRDKQFLELKGVPCRKRASAVTGSGLEKKLDEGEDDWVAPDEDVSKPAEAASSSAAPSSSSDDEDDMFDFSDSSSAPSSAGPSFRTYDATITYDIYYYSPRLYLKGYAEDGSTPLTPEQIFEDMATEHANKTATVDEHPHLDVPTASIHPCKHAQTMKSLIDREKEAGRQIKPEQYFFTFLKFVQTAIPTIELSGTVEAE